MDRRSHYGQHNSPPNHRQAQTSVRNPRVPDTVVMDNGPTFTSELVGEFMGQDGIRHIQRAPFHPASNGLAEQAVQAVKEGLKQMKDDSLSIRLSHFLFKYRLTSQTTTARSPAEMLMGCWPKSKLDLRHPDTKVSVLKKQEKQKEGHSQHAPGRQLKPGDNVYLKNFSNNSNQQWLLRVILMQRDVCLQKSNDLCQAWTKRRT